MNEVRWGILPWSGHFELRVLQPLARLDGARINAVASRDAAKAERNARRVGELYGLHGGQGPRAHGSYQALIDNPGIDAVYISLPNDQHLAWTLKALAAGKHVLCEKPFGMDAAQTRQAAAAAESAGRLVMEAFMYRFHPQWVRAKQIVDSGEIGRVSGVEAIFSYANKDPANIRNRPEHGGGALYDIGCYAVSCARWIIGAEPRRVMSLVDTDPDFGTDRLSSGILDFGTARSTFTVATQSAAYQQVTILGQKGSIRMNLPFNPYPDVAMKVEVRTGLGERIVTCGPEDQYASMFTAFSAAIRDGLKAPTPIGDAIGNMATLDALFESARSGTWATL